MFCTAVEVVCTFTINATIMKATTDLITLSRNRLLFRINNYMLLSICEPPLFTFLLVPCLLFTIYFITMGLTYVPKVHLVFFFLPVHFSGNSYFVCAYFARLDCLEPITTIMVWLI